MLGSAQIAVENGLRIVASGDYKDVADPTCAPFELVPCDVFITEATFGLPVFRHGDPSGEIEKLLRSVALFPERAHLVGAYALGKAQRVIALLRAAGYDRPIYLHGAMERITRYYSRAASTSAQLELVARRRTRPSSPARSRSARLARIGPLVAPVSRSGHGLRLGLDARARAGAPARRRAAAGDLRPCRLGRADATIAATGASEDLGDARPRGRAGALVRGRGLKARPLAWSATATRRRHGARPARPRHEPLRRTARPPRL